ncbi:hypothetical protein B0T17DRAFT_378663 [Bombardia bombarda]|uniref:Uncharacterized protein n=1 Tax=Bombardia bombarda TaxID=252184 RepID=A0AA39WGU4_9PEZI|nr:hypothetical protein B0T17DRAFT_378663 [Bombardia bombarda]
MPAVDLEVINFFQEPMAWSRPCSRASSPRGKASSEDVAPLRPNELCHQGLIVTPGPRSEVDTEFPPADRLCLSGSVSHSPTDSTELQLSMPPALARSTTKDIRHSPLLSLAQRGFYEENTFNNPIVIEDDDSTDYSSDDDNGDGGSSSLSELAETDTSTADELVTGRPNKSTEIPRTEPVANSSIDVDSLPCQLTSLGHATPDNECSGSPEDCRSIMNEAIEPRSLFTPGELSLTPTATSCCETEEGSETGNPADEEQTFTQNRHDTPKTVISRDDSIDSDDRERQINHGSTIICCHASEDDTSEDENARPPVKRRRTRRRPIAAHPMPLTRSRQRRDRCNSSHPRAPPWTTRNTTSCRYHESATPLQLEATQFTDSAAAATDADPAHDEVTPAGYQEWPFQGTIKCVSIGNNKNIQHGVFASLWSCRCLSANELDSLSSITDTYSKSSSDP